MSRAALRSVLPLVVGVVMLGSADGVRAVDFLRGDANGDRAVSISDVWFGVHYLFTGGAEPQCGDAADFNNDGIYNLDDPFGVLRHLVLGDVPPEAPYPEPGADDADGETIDEVIPCTTYGDGAPVDDPGAALRVLDGVAAGGTNRNATVLVAISSSRPVAGYHGTLDADGIFAERSLTENDLDDGVFDLSDTFIHGFIGVRSTGSRLEFGYMSSITIDAPLPTGTDVPALEIRLCLAPGTPAGQYPLTLLFGELADEETGQAIRPELVSGSLTVLEDVAEDECVIEASEPFVAPDFDVEFRLGESRAVPGGEAVVPLSLVTNGTVQGYHFHVLFDPDVLQVASIEGVFERPDGEELPHEFYRAFNDEGFAHGIVTLAHPLDDDNVPPRDVDVPFAEIRFTVAPDADIGPTPVVFSAKNQGVSSRGHYLRATFLSSMVLVDGVVNIIGEVTTFVRGDSNGDDGVDLSDAQFTLNYLFLGARAPTCLDAADANDDGAIDVSDAIATLDFLFAGGSPLPPPNGAPGTDGTDDELTCLLGTAGAGGQ